MVSHVKHESPVRVIVIDVLKPYAPSILDLGKAICDHSSVDSANISVYANDEKTESVKITIEGKSINFEAVKKVIEKHGAVIHSLDKVALGSKHVIEVPRIEQPRIEQ